MPQTTYALAFCLVLLSHLVYSQQPTVASGTLNRWANFPSKFVDARHVDVWLPDGYSTKTNYAVLYMHDGQMLFDSTTTWNKQEWGVDETLGNLLAKQKIRPCLVVAVWNVPAKRFADYFPQKAISHISEPTRTKILTQQLKSTPNADNYLKFLVTELKPFIDSAYSTRTDAASTFIMGSSMGGLISAYALCQYPNVFGGAACLSIHSPLVMPDLVNDRTDADVASKFRDYLATHLPRANTRKLYFDYGDQTLDSLYKPYQTAIDALMARKGYSATHWQTRFFPGESHSEQSWRKRLAIPLAFLLGKKP
ncbi:alpha/beta hydrolase [Fibrella aquatilis]|uniref:Esterase family protein n=1 Tax=Fibrella aquatilis TaxID=2817059 RepID=A0A939G8A3_9BACT|nr:alpha/beta fold hydrolase [Fibrella aquatilis]MBO0931623.1 esterase family protein [Fibrella aquatilis]